MICPYCNQETNDKNTKCEVCGVDLEYQINNKKNSIVMRTILFSFGIVLFLNVLFQFLSISIFSHSSFFNDAYVKSFISSMSFFPLLIALLFIGVKIIGMIRHIITREAIYGNNKPSASISLIIVCMIFLIIWLVSPSFMRVIIKYHNLFNNHFSILMVLFVAISIILFIIIVVYLVTRKNK